MISSKIATILELAYQDYLDPRYQESLASVAAKHSLDVGLFESYLVSEAGNKFFIQWERYQLARLTTYRQADRDGRPLVLRPAWYTGSTNSKSIHRHHVLWCLEHEETKIPTGYVIFHADGNYTTGAPSEYVCLTRSEHQHLINKRRVTNGTSISANVS
jgi:hypothetical protein